MSFAQCPENLKDAALWHASQGRPVFPVYFQQQPDGKVKKAPLVKNGFHSATTDPEQIKRWWNSWPEAGIGMPCGEASGLMAIDYDIEEGVNVHDVREEFHERFDLPQTLLVASVRGGLHEYLRYAPDVGRMIHAIHPSVDILGDGGYVILPPSRMSDGRAYKVIFDADPCEATESLLAAIRAGKGQPNLKAIDGGLTSEERLKDAQHWSDLAEPHKWHIAQRTLISRYVFRGIDPQFLLQLAPAFCRPPYSQEQTVKEIGDSIRGAVRKYAPTKPTERDPFPLIPLADIGMRGPPAWRVEGFIPERGLGVLYGPSGTYKSFIALDLALTVAHGLPWRGKPVGQAGAAYIAGEGTYGIQNRVVAWREHRGQNAASAPFWLAPVASNFLDPAVVKLMIERLSPLPVKLIIVDTLARAFGGGNENDAQDMNKFVAACDALAAACDAFVLAIHHTGKDADRGARGSSALKAAADVEISVSRGTDESCAVLKVTKMKEAEDGARVRIRMVPVDGVFPATGEVVGSLVPVVDESEPQGGVAQRLGKNERLILATLLNRGPQKFSSIRTNTGIGSSVVGRAIKTLFEKNLIERVGDDWSATASVSEIEDIT